MADINPDTKYFFVPHESGAILNVLVPPESTGYAEWIEIHMIHFTLLNLNLALQTDMIDWENIDGSLNVKGEQNKLTLIVHLKKVQPNETIIRTLDEDESRKFRNDLTLLL